MKHLATLAVAFALVVPSLSRAEAQSAQAEPAFRITRATPILFAERIEPLLDLWERLGFERQYDAAEEEALDFVILQRDGVEVMLQTIASARADDARLAETLAPGHSLVFMEVSNLDAIEAALHADEIVVPRRTTVYGAIEIYVRDPAGNVLGFAEFPGRE